MPIYLDIRYSDYNNDDPRGSPRLQLAYIIKIQITYDFV